MFIVWIETFRSLIEFSELFGGTLRGFVLLGVHVQFVYIVVSDKSVAVYHVSYFPWEGQEWERVVAHVCGAL